MILYELFLLHPELFTLLAAVLGAMVGSFLNVVIHRLPKMLEQQWRDQCSDIIGEAADRRKKPRTFNLAYPGSHCPQCGHQITLLENIPILSYIFLRGKCSACKARISLRYPLIEAITALLSAIVAWHFGFGWEATMALLFTWALIPLIFIDLDHQLLPDVITLPVLWLGLSLSLFGLFADPDSAIIGAMAGYLSLWSVYMVFKLLTGKEGMGYGDFKLLAMLGAWTGWQSLPVVILMSSLVGAVVGIGLILLRGRDRNIPIPFGPYLATAGWITLLWGHDLTEAYLVAAGLR